MIKLTKKHTISKPEDAYIVPFLENYYQDSEGEIIFSAIPEDSEKRPDYAIESTNTLVEIKEIHDRELNQKHAQWAKIITKLQKAVDENGLLSKVKGTFLVNTPEIFRTPTDTASFITASSKIISAVISNQKKINIFSVDFEINKVSKQESIVVFGTYGGGSSIDPSDVVYRNIKDKIANANNQLGNPPSGLTAEKKIVLLVNKYYFPLWNWDLFKAIARTYKDLLTYQNVDEIWYQFEAKEHEFSNKLLYKRSFFEQFESGKFEDLHEEDYLLFANWFSALSELGHEEKEKLFTALKVFLVNKKTYEIFADRQTREEIVKLGLWLAEKERFNDVVWFVQEFIDDPDPAEPDDFAGDGKLNLHLQIANNEDANTITTVLGHLSWVIQKLALQKNYIAQALKFTEKLLSHENLYVKLQALIPLIEISARRHWLEDEDKEKGTSLYGDFHSIVFSLLRDFSQYRAIGNWLTHVFYYYKDLNTEEAWEVLGKLQTARDAAALFVYFGIFRERHYKGKVKFDSEKLESKLKETILSKDEELTDLKGSIAWNFWKILEETPAEFVTIKPFLDLFFELPFNKRYYSSLERIIEKWIKQEPEICIPWFESTIKKLKEFVGENEVAAHNTWIDPEEIIKYIAQSKPNILCGLVSNLVELWKLGSFVGSPRLILESYKDIQNTELKATVKVQFEKWYKEMKSLNPKLEDILWD